MKNDTDTLNERIERIDKIDDLWACIENLKRWGYDDLASKVRNQAVKLKDGNRVTEWNRIWEEYSD